MLHFSPIGGGFFLCTLVLYRDRHFNLFFRRMLMLFLALVLNLIATARGIGVIGTIFFLILFLTAHILNKDHSITEKRGRITKILAFITSCLFLVEFLLGFIANFTWWPFILAMIFAIIYVFAKEKN